MALPVVVAMDPASRDQPLVQFRQEETVTVISNNPVRHQLEIMAVISSKEVLDTVIVDQQFLVLKFLPAEAMVVIIPDHQVMALDHLQSLFM